MHKMPVAVFLIAVSACDGADTGTKVLAENVLYENRTSSALTAGNVQDALDEIAPDLSAILTGAWSVKNYGQAARADGIVTFNGDGTYSVQGDFNAAEIIPSGGVNVTPTSFQVVSNKLVVFEYVLEGHPDKTVAGVVGLTPVEISIRCTEHVLRLA